MKLSVEQLLEVMRLVLENKRELLVDDEDPPDEDAPEKRKDEFSVAGGIAGVSVPLGAGPTHPVPTVDGRKKQRSKKSKR
jgi:hypothetical protein